MEHKMPRCKLTLIVSRDCWGMTSIRTTSFVKSCMVQYAPTSAQMPKLGKTPLTARVPTVNTMYTVKPRTRMDTELHNEHTTPQHGNANRIV